MRIVILGAGALGSIFGGYLARAGYEVTLLGRPDVVQAVQTHGLRISGRDEFVVYPRACSDAGSVHEADLLLVCVRTTDTAAALADVRHLRPEMVASLQNGVGKDETLVQHFGPRPVLGAATVMGARSIAAGHARCTLFGYTWFGELDNHVSARVQGLAAACRQAGLFADVPDNIQSVQWSKLAYLLPVSTLGGLTRLPYHQILQSPDLAYLFLQLLREVNKVARAYGVQLADYAGINSRTLVDCPFEQGVQMLVSRGKALQESAQTDISANMAHDLRAGQPSEIEAIAGDLVRFAQDAGLSLPAISFVYRAIRGIDSVTSNQ